MALNQDDVINILKLIDAAPVGHFSLQMGDFKLELGKGTGARAAAPAAAAAPKASATVVPAPSATDAPAAAPAPASAPVPGALAIKAPLLGIFYRRSQPGVPPYVEAGALVEPDTTVALIEVMKLFNPVKAGVKGRIVRICADNGALVEHGQELFLVEPV